MSMSGVQHLEGVQLADPQYQSARRVDVLLGVSVLSSVLQPGLRKGGSPSPVAQKTMLGWIVSGRLPGPDAHSTSSSICHSTSVDQELSELVKKFWLQEEFFEESEESLTPAEAECEKGFAETHTRNENGRFVVRLPLKLSPDVLGDSRPAALRMLKFVQRKLQLNPELRRRYEEFMLEYEALGHMSRVPRAAPDARVHYLPHFAVLREISLTTKLRVVFNASARTSTGYSLNDILHQGPNLQRQIVSIILSWRKFPFVFTADITKMFRQILVHEDDRDLQRILWFEVVNEGDHFTERMIEMQLNTVTYGTRPAPYLAMASVRQLAANERHRFPLAAEIVMKRSYMDDEYGGAFTLEECQEAARQLREMFACGGFPLQKWAANSSKVLEDIESSEELPQTHLIDTEKNHRALGIHWNSAEDFFFYQIKEEEVERVVTKRSVLSGVAQLYDPLGWISPVVVRGKLQMQHLWKIKMKWDDPIPDELSSSWRDYRCELPGLSAVRIPRHLQIYNSTVSIELHGFSDASLAAYGTVCYLRTVDSSGDVRVVLLSSKSKLAPLSSSVAAGKKSKTRVTIPRLELMAVSLLAKHSVSLAQALELDVPIHLWSDSAIALAWIRSDASRYKEFVKNRVLSVQSAAPRAIWHHVPGSDNPADLVSRGISVSKLVNSELWWSGPSWLRQTEEYWPKDTGGIVEDIEQEKRVAVATARVDEKAEWNLIHRFDTWKKLLAVTSWCRRVFRVFLAKKAVEKLVSEGVQVNEKSEFQRRVLSPEELEESRMFWVRETQAVHFKSELESLRSARQISRQSPIFRLTPYLDREGVIRLGGRIHYSRLPEDMRHPAILPRDSKLTELVLRATHHGTLHGGAQLMLQTLRTKFWIVGGRVPVKNFIHRCVICTRQRAEVAKQRMGQLPARRVNPALPFQHSGVDYAGPFHLLNWRHRGAEVYKAFLVVFVCFTTSAVHLEMATDYSAEGFLAAFKRFTSRRGICETVTSDCGTNFVGADRQLQELFDCASSTSEHIANCLARDGTKWIFNPPGAPHFGGKWEAAVKSTKFHLKRVLGEAKLTFEEFSTLLAQIESILNSRPLCPLHDDPEDLEALTPGHFLIGRALATVPEPSVSGVNISRLSRYQLIRRMIEGFWARWSVEYMQRLQEVNKWHRKETEVALGTMVLVVNECLPPSKWALGRVVQLHPGKDGLTRVVTIRTQNGTLLRPIAKLCVLPIESTSEDINEGGESQR